MGVNLDNKKKIVEEIKNGLKDCKSMVFVDYKGVKVLEDTAMRKDFRTNDVNYKVYKNRLLLIALKELGISGFDATNFEGSTAVCYSKDEVAPARIFCQNASKIKKMNVKFGIINGTVYSKEQIIELSQIPSKDILISRLLGQLLAPVSALARVLNAVAEKQN